MGLLTFLVACILIVLLIGATRFHGAVRVMATWLLIFGTGAASIIGIGQLVPGGPGAVFVAICGALLVLALIVAMIERKPHIGR
jgi:hypothetical protein